MSVKQVGMSLARMGKPSESVRFLDDVDLTFTLDSRSSGAHQSTSIEVTSLPIVFRASYRDIMLITAIVNKAIALYGNSSQSPGPERPCLEKTPSRPALLSARRGSRPTTSRVQPVGSAHVVTHKEQVQYSGVASICITSLMRPLTVQRLVRRIPSRPDWRSS